MIALYSCMVLYLKPSLIEKSPITRRVMRITVGLVLFARAFTVSQSILTAQANEPNRLWLKPLDELLTPLINPKRHANTLPGSAPFDGPTNSRTLPEL